MNREWSYQRRSADTNVLYCNEEIEEAISVENTILVVEGEKDADRLWSIKIPATCNAHGASEPDKKPKWTSEHSEQLRDADIVVIPDHDPAGYAHAETICRMSVGIAKRVRRLDLAKHWPECPKGGDISDWLDAGHSRKELDALIEKAPDWQDKDIRFKLIRFNQLQRSTAPPYLIVGLIPLGGLIVIWGPPKCGKSFWTFDAVMHVALGWPYRGRKVRQGAVVYLSLEGNTRFADRIDAFRQRHGVTDAPFYLVIDRTDLVKDHAELIAAIKTDSVKPAVVVIDTLNRSIAGSESKDEDMSAYIKAADAVREAFNCAVIIIHHCGIDERRPRGHTSLGGAVDAQLAVKRDTAHNIVTKVEWMKDGDAEGDEIVSKLEHVPLGTAEDGQLGTAEDGQPLSSCVVMPSEAPATDTTGDKLGPNQKTMFSILYDAGSHGLTVEEWNKIARDAGLGKKRKADLFDLRTALHAKGMIYQSGERWIAKRE
jgi:hypothetical protein